MKVTTENSIRYKTLKRIQRLSSAVILRRDIQNLGSARQISRALKTLVAEGVLVKLGYGIYAKLMKSQLTNHTYLSNGFLALGREALTKLGIDWDLSEAEREYNLCNTQQIPTNPATQLNTRFRRKISYRNMEMRFE